MRSDTLTSTVDDICLVRPLHSLTLKDVQEVYAMLVSLERNWSIEHHDDCEGDLFLLIGVQDPDVDGASFLLRRTSSGVELIDVAEEGYRSLGTFSVLEAAVRGLHAITA